MIENRIIHPSDFNPAIHIYPIAAEWVKAGQLVTVYCDENRTVYAVPDRVLWYGMAVNDAHPGERVTILVYGALDDHPDENWILVGSRI